jgi:hypothetical protein
MIDLMNTSSRVLPPKPDQLQEHDPSIFSRPLAPISNKKKKTRLSNTIIADAEDKEIELPKKGSGSSITSKNEFASNTTLDDDSTYIDLKASDVAKFLSESFASIDNITFDLPEKSEENIVETTDINDDSDNIKNIKRGMTINEIVLTERDYVKDLANMVYNCMDYLQDLPWLSNEKKQFMIRNSHQILKFHKILCYTFEVAVAKAVNAEVKSSKDSKEQPLSSFKPPPAVRKHSDLEVPRYKPSSKTNRKLSENITTDPDNLNAPRTERKTSAPESPRKASDSSPNRKVSDSTFNRKVSDPSYSESEKERKSIWKRMTTSKDILKPSSSQHSLEPEDRTIDQKSKGVFKKIKSNGEILQTEDSNEDPENKKTAWKRALSSADVVKKSDASLPIKQDSDSSAEKTDGEKIDARIGKESLWKRMHSTLDLKIKASFSTEITEDKSLPSLFFTDFMENLAICHDLPMQYTVFPRIGDCFLNMVNV